MKDKEDIDTLKDGNPFRVPDSFFDTLTNNTLQKAKARQRKKVILKPIYWSTSIAASFLILFFVGKGLQKPTVPDISGNALVYQQYDDTTYFDDTMKEEVGISKPIHSKVDKVLSEMTDEELDEISEISETDLFFVDL